MGVKSFFVENLPWVNKVMIFKIKIRIIQKVLQTKNSSNWPRLLVVNQNLKIENVNSKQHITDDKHNEQ